MRAMTLVLAAMVIIPAPAFADLNFQVQEMFDRLGFAGSSTTEPGIYEAQSRGYVTGGSISVRTPYDTLQPFTVSPPSIRAGCQGIDVFLGGFSYINLDNLVDKLKTIGTSALSYGFMIAIQTLCPVCEKTIEWLENVSRDINSIGMDTCRAAEAIAQGVLGEGGIIRTGQWGKCAQIGSATGSFEDFVQSWRACAEDLSSGMAAASEADKELASPEGNLVWQGLQELPLSDDLRELIMSTMGTLIITADSTSFVEGTIDIGDLVNGGEVEVLRCNTDKCLNPDISTESVDGLKNLVREKLAEGFEAIITKKEPPAELKQFIEALPSPVWRLLNVASAYPVATGFSYIEQQSDAIAALAASYWFDMAFRYTIQGINQASRKGLLIEQQKQLFYEHARDKHELAYKELRKSETKLNNFDTILKTIDYLEKRFMETMESRGILAQYNFSKNTRLQTR